MLLAYLDESGHESGEYVVLAGFLGTEEQWAGFETEWLSELGPGRSFHIKDLRWNKESTRRRLERLGAIPYRHGLKPLVGSVCVADYQDLAANLPEVYSIQGYYLALFPILAAVHLTISEGEHITWTFEEQHDYSAQAKRIFKVFARTRGEARFSDVSFVSKDNTCRTQIADFLAYAVLQRQRDANSDRAIWCRPILGDDSFLGKIVDRDMIRLITDFALVSAAALTAIQTGRDPRIHFAERYSGKREIHEALQRAEDARAKEVETSTQRKSAIPNSDSPNGPNT